MSACTFSRMQSFCFISAKIMREDAVEADEDEVLLEDGVAANDGLEVG